MLEHTWSVGCVQPWGGLSVRALNVHSGLRYYLGLGRVSEGVKSMEVPFHGWG